MTYQELRVGNYIFYGESARQITAIVNTPQQCKVGVDNLITMLEVIKPIPLNEEILLKAGFEKHTELVKGGINEEIEIWNKYVIDLFFDIHGCLVLKDYHVNINRPKYLHQLQNLYYALTGTELTINLEAQP